MKVKLWKNIALTAVLLIVHVGCRSYSPRNAETLPFLDRAQSQEKKNVRMTVAVPSAEECRAIFGVKMYRKEVQPVWVKIENLGNKPYLLFPISLDPDYYSPMEAAWRNGKGYSSKGKTSMGQHFDKLQTKMHIAPGQTVSGYVNTKLSDGTREVFLELIGDEAIIDFAFTVKVPGIKADHLTAGWEEQSSRKKTDIQTEQELRRAIEKLPRFTKNKKGTNEGDPLNLIVIGGAQELWPPFIRQNWDETEIQTWGTTWKTIGAFMFKRNYRHSPISSLYVFDRPQDVALQKVRDSIHARNHLRLWRTHLLYRGTPVWIGQISRDIGVRLTLKSPTIMTHKIDPDIDEARFYLLQDLVYSQGLARIGYAKGSEKTDATKPRKNLAGDPFYTDGLRLVLFLSSQPVARDEVDYVQWESPAQR